MSFKDRLSQLSDFQQKFLKENEGITDEKVLQEKYLNEAPTAKGPMGSEAEKEERAQDKLFWEMLAKRKQKGTSD